VFITAGPSTKGLPIKVAGLVVVGWFLQGGSSPRKGLIPGQWPCAFEAAGASPQNSC